MCYDCDLLQFIMRGCNLLFNWSIVFKILFLQILLPGSSLNLSRRPPRLHRRVICSSSEGAG